MRALRAALLLPCCGAALAAPLPPLPAADLCGRIVTQSWVAERHLEAVTGASGSLGRERTVPAHLRVVLGQVTGLSRDLAQRLSRLAGAYSGEVPAGGMLLLLAMERPDRLSGAATLCVTGYKVRGDEGITLTSYAGLTTR